MRRIYGFLTFAAAILLSVSCINKGGYVYGELPPGVALVDGEALEARYAVYNTDLNELTVQWRATADPDTYRGVEVSFMMLSGATKTVKIYANGHFASSYDRFSVVTVNPETVRYRCIWYGDSGEEVMSEWASVDDLEIRSTSSASVFGGLVAPEYKLVTEASVAENVVNAYADIVGSDEESQKKYYTEILRQVLASMYYTIDDSGSQPVTWLKCILGHMEVEGAVAYVSGDSEGPLMKMSSEYMSQVVSGSTSRDDAAFEIRGVLIHEFTHLVQKTGATGSNQPSCIEGFADAVRCACGGVKDSGRLDTALGAGVYYDPDRKSGETPCPYIWQMPYGTSGYFMSWLRYYDGDFLRKLAVTIQNMGSEWSLEKAVEYILGDEYDIQELWNEYVADARAEKV